MQSLALIFNDWRGLIILELLIKAGYDPICVDRRSKLKAKSEALPEQVRQAKTIALALSQSDLVLTILNNQQEDEDVYMAGGGILAAAGQKSLFIDFSNVTPRWSRELHALVTVSDHDFVEVGMVASPQTLALAEAVLFAAGEQASLSRAMPILEVLSNNLTVTGLPGTGITAAIAWQISLAGSMLGLVEALAFAGINNLDKQILLQILSGNKSPFAGFADTYGESIVKEDFAVWPDVRAYLDELNLALESADEADLPLPGLESVQQLYDLLQLIGNDRLGITSLALAYYDEKNSERFGLDWSLAQQAMDVYERGEDRDRDHGSSEDDYDETDDWDDESLYDGFGFDPYVDSSSDEKRPKPSTGSFFSDN